MINLSSIFECQGYTDQLELFADTAGEVDLALADVFHRHDAALVRANLGEDLAEVQWALGVKGQQATGSYTVWHLG